MALSELSHDTASAHSANTALATGPSMTTRFLQLSSPWATKAMKRNSSTTTP